MEEAKNYTIFYIVRHGETDWNALGLIQGHSNQMLNDAGRDQARELAKELKDVHFDVAYSSDLLRAKETAEIIIDGRNLAITEDQNLREKHHGSFEGKSYTTMDDLRGDISHLSYEEKLAYKVHPEIETDREVVDRFEAILKDLAQEYPQKTILIVTHAGVMRVLLVHLGLLPHPGYLAIANTSYAKIQCDGEKFVVEETKGIKLP